VALVALQSGAAGSMFYNQPFLSDGFSLLLDPSMLRAISYWLLGPLNKSNRRREFTDQRYIFFLAFGTDQDIAAHPICLAMGLSDPWGVFVQQL
jgi:hypothetical protein